MMPLFTRTSGKDQSVTPGSCDPLAAGVDVHRCQSLLQAVAGAVFFIDDHGLIQIANREAEELLGKKAGELSGQLILNLLPVADQQLWRQRLREAAESAEKRSLVESIASRQYITAFYPVFTGTGGIGGMMISRRDITEQRISEVRYQELCEHISSGVVVLSRRGDDDCFVVREMNHAVAKILALPKKAVIGQPITAVLPGLADCGLLAAIERVHRQGSAETFTAAVYQDSQRRLCLQAYLFALLNREVVLVFEDCTSRYDAEQALRQSKEQWEKTFDSLTDIVTIQDRQLRIVRANLTACQTFGLSVAEMAGNFCYQVFQGTDAVCTGCPVQQTHIKSQVYNGVIFNQRLQRYFDVRSSPIYDDAGEMVYIVHVARDVTEQRQREGEHLRLTAAIEQVPESVAIIDRSGLLLYANSAFCLSCGYGLPELRKMPQPLLPEADLRAEERRSLQEELRAGRIWRGRVSSSRADGRRLIEDVSITPVFDAAGEICSYIQLKRDVSREAALEQQLQQAMRLEAIGTLAGGIAHDFNNILSAIIGFGQLAKGRLTGDHPVQRDLEQILAGGERAVDLVKQILAFSRDGGDHQFRPVPVPCIVKETVKLLRSSCPTTIDIQVEIDPHCPLVQGDPGQLHQVTMNLCTNARLAIGEAHGQITISLAPLTLPHRHWSLKLPGLPPGDYLHLQVRDTGCGMEATTLARIFDPFFTTRPKEQGTGLGLSVVHGIVKKHQGEIIADSSPGRGAVFDLFFPALDEMAVEEQEAAGGSAEYRGSERILIVDDEPLVAEVSKRMLHQLGYQVLTFTSSMEAVAFFRVNPACCDLVVTDMTMPQMTGLELAREMLSLREKLPVLMMTGFSEGIDLHKVRRAGIADLLIKPVAKTVLGKAVRETLDRGAHTDL